MAAADTSQLSRGSVAAETRVMRGAAYTLHPYLQTLNPKP